MQRYHKIIGQLRNTSHFFKCNTCSIRCFSTDKPETGEELTNKDDSVKTVELSGFAKAFNKFAAPEPEKPTENQNFAYLLRNSKFIDLGDPEGKIVSGKIFHVVGDDLYIDFGWKFHCVCPRPVKNANNYIRGSTVRLRIKDLELSTKFLGATKDLTILEADCTLIGLISTPMRNVTTV